MSKLRKLLQRSRTDRDVSASPPPLGADGWSKGEVLRLPRGTIVAEQNVRHLPSISLATPAVHLVAPLLEEAYIVVRLDDGSSCYATWQPYAGSWQLLHLDAELSEAAGADEFRLFKAPRKLSAQ